MPKDQQHQFLNLRDLLNCRGPDCNNLVVTESTNGKTTEGMNMSFYSTVLSMRDPMVAQPLVSGRGMLQFNGEIYSVVGDLEHSQGLLFGEQKNSANDTEILLSFFEEFGVLDTLERIRGEYALVYYDRLASHIWWARDCIGRRSLMLNDSREEGSLSLSSVAPTNPQLRMGWTEVRAGTVYQLNIDTLAITEIPWMQPNSISTSLKYPYGDISSAVSAASTSAYSDLLNEFASVFGNSVRRRVLAINHSPAAESYAILFSGGIDCTLIAYFTAIILQKYEAKIDLLNVAFENPRIGGGYNTPDRILGRRSWDELISLPQVKESRCKFRFVEINIPYSEVLEYKSQIQDLMYPKDSVMDFSIALAFFFAARGKGTLFESLGENVGLEYTTSSRILLSGLGADELYAGYTRHASVFIRKRYDALVSELSLDFGRLHERNLGRDDRVGSHWSKEFRYPFLDEEFVAFALSCPLDCKMRLYDSNVNIVEGKWLLRQFARNVGLTKVSEEKKRAIQFGARSAKMEAGQGKTKGTAKFI